MSHFHQVPHNASRRSRFTIKQNGGACGKIRVYTFCGLQGSEGSRKTQTEKEACLRIFLRAVSAESLSEDDEVEVDSSSEIESPDENIEEGSCSSEEYSGNEESETKTSGKAATSNRKPKA